MLFTLGITVLSSSTASSMSHGSRSSTPPTEISSNLSSPTFAPPVETEETRRRRQQSDQASIEIGKRLLKGWAMLAEECLNPRCYSIPLVRPPKTGGDKGPRKVWASTDPVTQYSCFQECVICGTVYVTANESGEWQRLLQVPVHTANNALDNASTVAVACSSPQVPVPANSQMKFITPLYLAITTSYSGSCSTSQGWQCLWCKRGTLTLF